MALSALAAIFSTANLSAADWYLQASHGLSQNWNTLAAWYSQPTGGGTNPTAISSADTYHTNGFQVRTPEVNVASPFPGTLALDGGSILVKQNGTGMFPVTIANLASGGGTGRTISNGSGGTQVINITNASTTRSEVTPFSTSGSTRGLNLSIGTLSGNGDLQMLGAGTIQFGVTNGANFYGAVYVTGNTTLTVSSATNIKGALVVEAGSKINLNGNLTVSSAVLGGTTNGTDGLPGLRRTGTALAPNTTYTFAQLQAAYPAIFVGGSGSITVTQPALAVNAADTVGIIGEGQMGVNLGAGKYWNSTSPNYRADLNMLRVGMVRTPVTPEKGYSLADMDIRVAQILNSGGVPLFVGPITKPNPPFTTEQQHIHDGLLDMNGTPGAGTIATNIAFLVQRYKAAPFNLTTQYWEVGNEPDITIDYQVASPQEYIDIYQSVHNQLIASGVRGNVKLCGPVVAFEYGFAANGNRTDNILNAFFQQCAAPLNGYPQVDILTRHVYPYVYDWETNSPKTTYTAYNLLNAPCEQVTFTQAQVAPWTYRGEGAILAKLKQYGFPASTGTGITEFNVSDPFRHTITQGLWFLTYQHFSAYNPRNVLSSGFVFDSTSNAFGYYKGDKTRSFPFWATYIHNHLTGNDILAQSSSDPHLLVTGSKDDTYVYVQVVNRNDADMTAGLTLSNAPVSGSATMFELSATTNPETPVSTALGTSFTYTYPAMTSRVFRYLRTDAPTPPTPPAPPANVLLDTSFDTAPTGMLTYHTAFQPVVTAGDLKLTNTTANMTAAVVFNGQPLAASQKRMQAKFGYRINSGHAGSGFVFAAYSANPGAHGAAAGGLGHYGQANSLWGVKIQNKGATPDQIAIFPGNPNPSLEGWVSQPLPPYPFGYAMDMFVVIDYDGDTQSVRARLYQGTSEAGALIADCTNFLGVAANLPAGTVFGFTGSTTNFSEITLIQNLRITTDNGAAPVLGTPFTLQSWTSAPWNAVNGATSFSGAFSPVGVPVTMTFGAPKTGVNVTTPSAPNFSSALNSFFGFEATGFGVGDSGLGRFVRGESFTLSATQKVALQQINWREWTGDEQLHIQWTANGATQQQLVTVTSSLQNLSGITADANTPIVITNVSASTANLSGRLRANYMVTALSN